MDAFFFNNQARIALREWKIILRYAYFTENNVNFYKKVVCPAPLIQLLPELESLVSLETEKKIKEDILRVAPLVEIEEWEKEYGSVPESGMKPCFEAVLLKQGLGTVLTFKALQKIALKLNLIESQQVVDWAESQYNRIHSTRENVQTEKLYGTKYLLTELPELEESLLINSSD